MSEDFYFKASGVGSRLLMLPQLMDAKCSYLYIIGRPVQHGECQPSTRAVQSLTSDRQRWLRTTHK